jgi:hypothetical protein
MQEEEKNTCCKQAEKTCVCMCVCVTGLSRDKGTSVDTRNFVETINITSPEYYGLWLAITAFQAVGGKGS